MARYDLKVAARKLTRQNLRGRAANMWRYAEVLPARDAVSLGEGMTPLIPAPHLGERLGLAGLFIKDEGLNPTGSFKARGMSAAVSRAKELGAKTLERGCVDRLSAAQYGFETGEIQVLDLGMLDNAVA